MVSACFDPWVGKIPWRREWLPTAVFLPGEFLDRRTWWVTVHYRLQRVGHEWAAHTFHPMKWSRLSSWKNLFDMTRWIAGALSDLLWALVCWHGFWGSGSSWLFCRTMAMIDLTFLLAVSSGDCVNPWCTNIYFGWSTTLNSPCWVIGYKTSPSASVWF